MAEKYHKKHERKCNLKIDHSQIANPFIDTEHNRSDGHRSNGKHDDDLQGRGIFQAENFVESSANLLAAQPERGGQPKQGAENGQDIHGVTDAAINTYTDQWI